MSHTAHNLYEIENVYPPKHPDTGEAASPLWYKGIYSIVLYLGLGYMLLRRWDLLLLIFGIVLLHELGHFFAMRYYHYTDIGILFLPFIGAWVQGNKNEISQRQSIIILLAGPVPGILLGLLLHWLDGSKNIYVGAIPLGFIAQLLIWANLLNLLPLYPLDGGQLLHRIFLDEEERFIHISMLLSIIATIWISTSTHFYPLLIIPALLIYRFINDRSNVKLEKAIEASGIDINTTYEALSNEAYWKLRAILIQHIPYLHHVKTGPPYVYDTNESRIVQLVKAVLQKNLLLDVSAKGKIVLAIVWLVLLSLPWLFDIDFLLLKYLTP